MTADELTAPLGQTPRKRGANSWLRYRTSSLARLRCSSAFSCCGRSRATILSAANRGRPRQLTCAPPRRRNSGNAGRTGKRPQPAKRRPAIKDRHRARPRRRKIRRQARPLSTSLPASLPPSPPPNTKTITIIDGKTGARREVVIHVPSGAAVVPAEQKPPTARALPTASRAGEARFPATPARHVLP